MPDSPNTAEMVVLNGMADVLIGQPPVLSDARSRRILETVFERETDERQRDRFERELRSLLELESGEYDETSEEFDTTLRTIMEVLKEDSLVVELDHRSGLSFTDLQKALYNFSKSPTQETLADVTLPASVEDDVHQGVDRIAEGDFAEGAELIARRVDDVRDDDEVLLRSLAGWGYFWAGDDSSAWRHARTAGSIRPDDWAVELLGLSMSYSLADRIRNGSVGLAVYLKWVSTVPDGASLDVAVGTDDGTEPESEAAASETDYTTIECLDEEMWIQFSVRGTLTNMPSLSAYHVGLGTVDYEIPSVLDTARVLKTGPITNDAIESITFSH